MMILYPAMFYPSGLLDSAHDDGGLYLQRKGTWESILSLLKKYGKPKQTMAPGVPY